MSRQTQKSLSSMEPTQITVVVPILNEAVQLTNLIRSLSALGLGVVFVDGGSVDASVRIVADAQRRGEAVRLLHAAAGRGRQLQLGLAAVSTEIVLFLHADCRLPGDVCQQIGTALADRSIVGGAFGTRHVGRFRNRLWLRLSDLRSRTRRDAYGDQAIFARTAVLKARGGVPDLPLFEDIELSRRVEPSVRCAGPVRVSARRHARAPIKATLMVNLFPTLYQWGVPVEVLSRWYKTMNTSDTNTQVK